MVTCNPISAPLADQICDRLHDVATTLRAMRDLCDRSISDGDAETLTTASIAVTAMSERAHLMLDACIKKMGGVENGNYRDEHWEADQPH